MSAYFNSGYPGVSKELLATAGDISFCLVFQKLLLYREVKRSTHIWGAVCCIIIFSNYNINKATIIYYTIALISYIMVLYTIPWHYILYHVIIFYTMALYTIPWHYWGERERAP